MLRVLNETLQTGFKHFLLFFIILQGYFLFQLRLLTFLFIFCVFLVYSLMYDVFQTTVDLVRLMNICYF